MRDGGSRRRGRGGHVHSKYSQQLFNAQPAAPDGPPPRALPRGGQHHLPQQRVRESSEHPHPRPRHRVPRHRARGPAQEAGRCESSKTLARCLCLVFPPPSWRRRPALFPLRSPGAQVRQDVRNLLSGLFGGAAEEYACVTSTCHALNIVAAGIDWHAAPSTALYSPRGRCCDILRSTSSLLLPALGPTLNPCSRLRPHYSPPTAPCSRAADGVPFPLSMQGIDAAAAAQAAR